MIVFSIINKLIHYNRDTMIEEANLHLSLMILLELIKSYLGEQSNPFNKEFKFNPMAKEALPVLRERKNLYFN